MFQFPQMIELIVSNRVVTCGHVPTEVTVCYVVRERYHVLYVLRRRHVLQLARVTISITRVTMSRVTISKLQSNL